MKNYIKHKSYSLFTMAIVAIGVLFTSCEAGDIDLGKVDDSKLTGVHEVYGYVRDSETQRNSINVDLRTSDQANELYIGLTKASEEALNFVVELDENYVDTYNRKHITAFKALPASQVVIANGGALSVAKGELKSAPISVTFKLDPSLEKDTYLVPIVVNSDKSGAKLSGGEDNVIYYVVRYIGDTPNVAKDNGIVSICYVEVNDDNPLNVGAYYLKDSGKPLFDIAIIFAANINFDAETGHTILHFNDNIEHVLKYRDKYIRPLQEKGIKVLLSVLGNHYPVGVANLEGEALTNFAAECKATIDAYGLDGIDFDDEYSKYGNTIPGFTFPSSSNTRYADLLIEMRRLLPDKLITVYNIGQTAAWWGGFASLPAGYNIGNVIDYSYYPYYGSYSGKPNWEGLEKSQYGPAPIRFLEGDNYLQPRSPLANSRRLVSEGYGVNLCYNLRHHDYTQILSDEVSTPIYGEETIHEGNFYRRDW